MSETIATQQRMDVPRKNTRKYVAVRRGAALVAVLLALAAVTWRLSLLRSAPPVVDRNMAWVGTVERGEFAREVRGNGTLVPKEEWWIPAPGEGRIAAIHIEPGETVAVGQIIVTLDDPELQQTLRDARLQLQAAESELDNIAATLESEILDKEEAQVTIAAQLKVAKLEATRDEQLYADGILSAHLRDTSAARYEELQLRENIARRKIDQARLSAAARKNAQQTTIDQLHASLEHLEGRVGDLEVRSDYAGVLKQISVEHGQRVEPGSTLARVTRPDLLKAQLRISQTQTRDIVVGQKARIDTRNGIIDGRVARIDPAVLNGTVEVDVELEGELPRGARADLSVEGVIELERVADVLFVGRPVSGGEFAETFLFKLTPDQAGAVKTRVRLGRASAKEIEVLEGLDAGDRVILSDMSRWEDAPRIQLD